MSVTMARGPRRFPDALATATLPNGQYQVVANLTDRFGNSAPSASRTLSVDETVPPLQLALSKADQFGASQTETTSAHVTLVGQTGAGDSVALSDGQTSVASNTGAFQFTNVSLSQGANILTVQSTDPVGNINAHELTVDRLVSTGTVDAAVQWNKITLQAIAAGGSNPAFASRALAMESLAVFDAVSSIDGTPGYLLNMPAPADADVNAAASQAAHDVLAYLYPLQQFTFDTALATSLAAIPDSAAKTDSRSFGSAVAAQIIALRRGDG